MPIVVKLGEECGRQSWAIVELQGDIRSHAGTISGTNIVGDLHFLQDGTPTLIIGHHLLYGKETKFEKPLAIMQHLKRPDGFTEYQVKAIITKKLLFKTRPKPIII